MHGKKIFFKTLSEEQYFQELSGYNTIKNSYPVPKLLKESFQNGKGKLIFEYADCVKKNAGLLIDVLNTEEQARIWARIVAIYKKIFLTTIKKIDHSADEVFFRERVTGRLNNFYFKPLWQKYDRKRVNLNGRYIVLNPSKIVDGLQDFYKNRLKTWGVLSQGDPTDLNICTKPLFFDFQASGYNYLTSEFANLYWNMLAQGDYFAPYYHSGIFKNHQNIYALLNKPVINNGVMVFKPAPYRKQMLVHYVDEVFSPCLKKITAEDKNYEWYNEFKYFIAMRILCVYNLNNMTEIDRLLSMSFLQLFFEEEICDPMELVEKIWT